MRQQQPKQQQQQEHCKWHHVYITHKYQPTFDDVTINLCEMLCTHNGHCQCTPVNFNVAQVKGILVSTLKLPAKSNNVDILD